ncbi:MAG: TatD family hydrolase [Bacteroidetes bacterium]|nr:TatD family hydrolase [Bacteroidota bacterium]
MAFEGYIDIHTHKAAVTTHISICNLYKDYNIVQSGFLYSIGLHPWYITAETFNSEFEQLEKVAGSTVVLAIGECGLDKLAKTDWGLQVQTFEMQIKLANKLNKPLIIHCVRAYEEVLKMLKECELTVPVIFHGFNKKLQVAEQILKEGYYLSFGTSLLKDIAGMSEVLLAIPAEKFFLETDDSGLDIGVVYQAAATIRKTPVDTLILQLQKNFETVFKK